MQLLTWFPLLGLVLLFILISAFPALKHKQHYREIRKAWAAPLLMLNHLLVGELGAVVVTYVFPTVSGTTPPTPVQASQVQTVVATVSFADADTVALITHNFNVLTTSQSPNTAQFFPDVTVEALGVGTAYPGLSLAWTNGNLITLSKLNTTVGSGGTVLVRVKRPQSIGQ